MTQDVEDTSRLSKCGWNSFRPELFLNEPGRRSRDVGDRFLSILQEFSQGTQVLELCCGAGRLLTHLARSGYEMVGLDLSAEMLEICREEASRSGRTVDQRIRLVQADMCTFDLKQAFDFIILEDDGFVYLLTLEDQLSCLSRVRDHLIDGGYFFLSFTTPERELPNSCEVEYDPVLQVKTSQNRWENGDLNLVQEGFERRKLTYPSELELLLKSSGLEPVHRWGDLNRNAFTDPLNQEYNYLIKRTA